jgi:hypothetical protein
MERSSTHEYNNSASNGRSRKSVTMTFRVDENIMNALKQETEKRQVSLNTLVNQILKRFIDWDMYEPKVGMIPIAKPVVTALFDNMREQDIVEMASKVGKNAIHDIALFMNNKMDLASFLSWFETRMAHSAIELNHKVQNYSHTYVMKHDLGYNWSLYHKTLLVLMFNEIFRKRADVAITSTTLLLKFEE